MAGPARDGWPSDRRLLICATDYRSGRRVAFGAEGAPRAPLVEAVAASAAVPGYYAPVRIGGRRYVDGGVTSFTNADVVRPYEPDRVVLVSPFGSTASAGPVDSAAFGPLRRAIARQARREADGLRRGGARVVLLEPSPEDLAVMGPNPMRRGHVRAVLEQARASVARSAWPDLGAHLPRALTA